MHAAIILLLLAADAGAGGEADEEPEAPKDTRWIAGDHATTEWGGARTFLQDAGFTVDAIYVGEVFANLSKTSARDAATDYLGHADLQLTFDTTPKLWPGGKFLVLAQANHGRSITEDYVGAYSLISNLEGPEYVQLGEFFFEQTIKGVFMFRLGKQDSNRDFGTPRYGGNFINNSFGAVPTVPMPSYYTQGLGAYFQLDPIDWLTIKAGIYEGQPQLASFGFDTAFRPGAGFVVLGGVTLKHVFDDARRFRGTTSISAWGQYGSFTEVTSDPAPRAFTSTGGLFLIHDEHFGTWTLNVRGAWTPQERQDPFLYVGLGIAVHDMPWAHDDTVGMGWQVVRYTQPLAGLPDPGNEYALEFFYKARLTKFFSVQPDFQVIINAGGDGPLAVVAGMRFKVKL